MDLSVKNHIQKSFNSPVHSLINLISSQAAATYQIAHHHARLSRPRNRPGNSGHPWFVAGSRSDLWRAGSFPNILGLVWGSRPYPYSAPASSPSSSSPRSCCWRRPSLRPCPCDWALCPARTCSPSRSSQCACFWCRRRWRGRSRGLDRRGSRLRKCATPGAMLSASAWCRRTVLCDQCRLSVGGRSRRRAWRAVWGSWGRGIGHYRQTSHL